MQRQGFLAIDIIDSPNDQVAWHGAARVRDPNARIAEHVVVDLMREYPPIR